MDALRHAAEGRHALSLASRRYDDGLLSGIILEIVHADQGILRHVEAAKFRSRRDDVDHAAAFHNHLPAVLVSGIDDLLHTVHVGSECRDDDSRILVFLEELVDGLSDRLLRRRKTRTLRIGGVAQKRKNTFSSQLRESLQVDRISEYRRIVDLEVARMDHDSRRCVNRERSGVYDAVVGLDKFHPEASQRHRRAEGNDLPLGRLHHAPLFELILYDAHGEPCGEHRDIDLLKNIRQRAYVILVAVGYDNPLYLVDVVLKICSQ